MERGFEEEYTYMMRELYKDQVRLISLLVKDPTSYDAWASGKSAYSQDRWYT